ncbi:MAG TPA: c-type cytochrome [Pyrinomonadaceae bacterium]|nr:c-type cytochrome [Pyrinomonadaceae bacterium]
MKNYNRIKLPVTALLAAFALFTLFAGSSKISQASAIGSENGNPILADASSNYAAYCSRCHGGDGRGQTAKGKQTHAPDLTKSAVGDAKGIRIITNGAGSMPGFKDNMSADDIRALMNYVRGFRH